MQSFEIVLPMNVKYKVNVDFNESFFAVPWAAEVMSMVKIIIFLNNKDSNNKDLVVLFLYSGWICHIPFSLHQCTEGILLC